MLNLSSVRGNDAEFIFLRLLVPAFLHAKMHEEVIDGREVVRDGHSGLRGSLRSRQVCYASF